MAAPDMSTTTGALDGPAPNRKVLIVDDEPDVLESTALLVESLGYEAIRLDDPGKILETVEQLQPALLLQDVRMAHLNLAGLVATLRSNPVTAEIPLVLFSAHQDLASTASRYGAWDYLQKPFSRHELSRMLERAIGQVGGAGMEPKSLQRELKTIFHDQWNLLAAISNYAEVLKDNDRIDPETRHCIQGLYETLLKLEAKTDRLRSYVMSVAGSLEAVPQTTDRKRR